MLTLFDGVYFLFKQLLCFVSVLLLKPAVFRPDNDAEFARSR